MSVPAKIKKLFKGPSLGGHSPTLSKKVDGTVKKDYRQACIMEFVNLISPKYDIWGTDASCVDESLTSWAITFNDSIEKDSDREKLLKFAPRFLGTDFKKNHTALRKGAYEWAKYYTEKYDVEVETYDPHNYWSYTGQKPYKLLKKNFSNWEKAREELSRLLENLFDSGRYEEAEKFFNTVLPDGECVEPDWDRARAYFEEGKLPDKVYGSKLSAY